MKLRFYKENDCWYADVPGHTQEENEMVSGSDDFLDYISDGKSEVILHVSKVPTTFSRFAYATLFMLKHNEAGATYQIVSDDDNINAQTLWICNVTHDVLGEHPSYIFVYLDE